MVLCFFGVCLTCLEKKRDCGHKEPEKSTCENTALVIFQHGSVFSVVYRLPLPCVSNLYVCPEHVTHHMINPKRSFKEYDANDKVEAMMKEQIAKSASNESMEKKIQSNDSAAAADAPAETTGAAAAVSATGTGCTNKKVSERDHHNLY